MPPPTARPGAAPAARPGAAPAARPGAPHPATSSTTAGAAGDQPAGDGTQLTDDQALTRWRFPIATRYGAVVLAVYTDRNTPTGDPATLDGSSLGAEVARLAGAVLTRNWTAARAALGDTMHTVADFVGHVHLGIHWKPAKPAPAPPIDQPPGILPTPNPVASASQGG